MRVVAITLALAWLVGGCSRNASSPAPVVASTSDPAEDYQRYCALCHGEDREGYAADNAPSLRSPELIGLGQGRFIIESTAFGRPGTPMAAFLDEQGGPLSRPQITRLHDWLVDQADAPALTPSTDPVEGEADRGSKVYQAHCASCHGAQGEGGAGPALSNEVFLGTVSDARLREMIARGRSGTPMPAYREVLSDRSLNDVTLFVRGLASGGWSAPEPVQITPPPPERAVIHPEGAIPSLPVRQGLYVPVDEVHAAFERGERMVMLDARAMSDWQRGHVPGALPVPYYGDFTELLPHLPRDGTPIIAYCACPHAASGRVVRRLRAQGFEHAVVLDEGIVVWRERGYPLIEGSAP
ncbi:MAG: cytochrome c, diheme subunit of cytochrome bc complex peta [Deltaproteobacteria bacterium]|nr:MAG: cytochrome c, diheme subunit of cytochrome bc complex peta [Deltaproteobacteria bacterium]